MSAQNKVTRSIRVGALVVAALVVLMAFLFFIGSEKKLFARKDTFRILVDNASGLAEGNPVKISGVTVGTVRDIWLPRDPKQDRVKIEISVVEKFAPRIRTDSRIKIRKLGLLTGDSFVDISPGSPDQPALPPDSVIPSAKATDVDALIASGEDLVDNFSEISYSLKNILSRVDRGEGLLGELTQNPQTKQRMTETVLLTLNKVNAVLAQIESGRGVLGKFVYDEKYAGELTASLNSSLHSLQLVTGNIQSSFETNSGALPLLLTDRNGRQRVESLITNLETTSKNLAAFTSQLQTGQGLLPRLVNDKPYADDTLKEFQGLVNQLGQTVEKLNKGEGTAGRLIADPSVYESINDILIGINESKLLRWLVRNRQAKGIESRYSAAKAKAADSGTADAVATPAPSPATPEKTPEPSPNGQAAAGAMASPAPTVSPSESSVTPSPSPMPSPADPAAANAVDDPPTVDQLPQATPSESPSASPQR
ncbi:MAG: MlaD family protein [Acidobacteriota bacterium]